LLTVPWLPQDFEERVLGALNTPSPDYAGYIARVDNLRSLFRDLTRRLVADGEYGGDAIGEAFVRGHDEPGRGWNMDEWDKKHAERNA